MTSKVTDPFVLILFNGYYFLVKKTPKIPQRKDALETMAYIIVIHTV